MRLLYVIDSLAPGGAETSLAEMAAGLMVRGIDLHVLPLGDRLDLAPRLEASGAVVHRRDTLGGRAASFHEVSRVARSTRPALVHTTLYESDVTGRAAARLLQIPASTSIVNDSYSTSHYAESNWAKLSLARALDSATAITARRFHAISTAIADSVAPRLGVPRRKVQVIARGRDPQSFPFRPAGLWEYSRDELKISREAFVVLSVGRLEPQKGIHHLLNALPTVAQQVPQVVLLIAGKEGRASRDLRSMAAGLRLDVRFLGHRADVSALLAAADVLCFPSEREGFGGVLIEALAVGCPVVASSLPTTLEVLGEGSSCVGLLADTGDPADLAAQLLLVLTEPRAALARAERGRLRFEERFSIDHVASEMASFFERVAGGPA